MNGSAEEDPMPMLDDRSGFTMMATMRAPVRIRRYAILLLGLFGLGLVGLLFLPWQQFVHGSGRVVALDPLERSVTVEAPLAGRVLKAHVLEGQRVKQGDTLFELMDNDPNFLANLNQQKTAATTRRQAAVERIESISQQLAELERALPLAVEAARTRLDAAKFAATTARQQYERIEGLASDSRGLVSKRDFELALLERDRTQVEVARADAELKRAEVDLRVTLNSTRAQRDSARADLAMAEQALVSLEIQVSQTAMQRVTAPRDGIILKVSATEGSFLRAGSALCTLIPSTSQRMVEIWLSGNDMPFVQPRELGSEGRVEKAGSPVRIQFEGWPAIQIMGWPSAAVGTFGGEVVLVDPTDNGKGKFRALIAEKPDVIWRGGVTPARTNHWPSDRWLRQGVRANGWVLLKRVPLWFEVWRQVNGFPPVVSPENLEKK